MTFTIKLQKKHIVFAALVILLALTLSTAAVSVLAEKDDRFSDVKIYLSPSNQYSNYYATGNTTEMEQCDKIAEKTAEYLEDMGFAVMVGQSGDTMDNRCAESDDFGADMHIPIHTNALDGTYTGGTHVYVYSEDEETIANYFYEELGSISPGDDDRIEYKPELFEIYTPAATTVYLECEFHDTEQGAKWIEKNTDKIANAIADSVYNYYSDVLEKSEDTD